MQACKHIPGAYGRTVGDPIDVVTGANLDVTGDFRLFGPLPLEWRRYYDSSQNGRLCALGWGHTHEYDRRLEFDVDGLRYVAPVGRAVGFAPLLHNGAEAAEAGVALRRVEPRLYQVRQHGLPTFEFQFRDSWPAALLTRAFRGDHAISFSYGPAGFLEGIVDSLGRRLRVETDPQGRVLTLTLLGPTHDKDRRLLTCRYDAAGNFVEGTDAYKHAYRFRYDRNNRMVSRTDRRGYTFHFEYDKDGRCVRSAGEDGLHEVRLRYLPLERVTHVTKADGGQWSYFYNEQKVLTQVIDPYGGATRYQLDDQGRAAEEVDPNGNVSKMVYDGAGGLTGKVTPLGDFVAIPEDPGAPDPRAHRVPSCPVEWEYGDLLPRKAITLPASNDPVLGELPEFAVRFVQTLSAEQMVDVDRPAPGSGRHATPDGQVYDELGLLLSESRPDGGTRRWTYDANGNRARYHDADGKTYQYEYTSWDLRSKTIDPLGNAVIVRYTPSGKKAAVTDPGGAVHEFVYDHKDRLTQVRRQGVLMEEYRYDPADAFVEKRDGKGHQLLSFEIGPGNLPAVRRLASGETHSFEYDHRGRYLRATTDDVEVKFEYDSLGNRTEELRDGKGVEHKFEGRWLAETKVFGKFTTRYRRRPDGTLVIEDPGGKEHTVRFLEHGLALRTCSNGSAELAQYDGDGRCLLKVHHRSGSVARAWARSYTYSPEGDLLALEDTAAGASHYTYDAAHRLVAARLPSGQEQFFDYDRAGNLLRQPGLNNVVVRDGNRLTEANGARFEYNERQDLAVRHGRDGATHYTYDARDNLVRCEKGEETWEARYDALAKRVSKSYGTKKTEYYWDTDRVAAEINETGRVRVYVYADAFAFVPLLFLEYDSLDADPASGRRYVLFCNQIGAPVRVEDDWGDKVWGARLDPYGTAHVDPSSRIDLPLRFPGHYLDEETGLHYNRFRYYSPELGRYIQSDPLGIGGGLNVYAYPAGPLSRVDVRGETECSDDPPGDAAEEDKKKKQQTGEEEPKPLAVPQGLTEEQFAAMSAKIRAGAGHLGDDIQVQGSRAAGTARPDSDIDIAIRVPPEQFDRILAERFGTPNPGSAKERTMQHAQETGKIQAGEAGLRPLRKDLERDLGMPVDVSVIREGGPFDNGPMTPIK